MRGYWDSVFSFGLLLALVYATLITGGKALVVLAIGVIIGPLGRRVRIG